MLRGENKPQSKWTFKDRIVAMALTVYEDGICKGCGQPAAHSHGDDPHEYEVGKVVCHGCKELADFQGKVGPGEKLYLEDMSRSTA